LRYALAAIPVIMLVVAVPFVDRVEPRVLGMPFLLVWIVFWILTMPIFLSLAERLRRAS
jgi:hypothetical protein